MLVHVLCTHYILMAARAYAWMPLYFAADSLFFPTHPRCHRREYNRSLPHWKSAIFENSRPKFEGTSQTWVRKLSFSGGFTTTSRLKRKNLRKELNYWQKVRVKLYELWPTNDWDFRVHFCPRSENGHDIFGMSRATSSFHVLGFIYLTKPFPSLGHVPGGMHALTSDIKLISTRTSFHKKLKTHFFSLI